MATKNLILTAGGINHECESTMSIKFYVYATYYILRCNRGSFLMKPGVDENMAETADLITVLYRHV